MDMNSTGGPSATVDTYNSTSGGWTTASLLEACSYLVHTLLPRPLELECSLAAGRWVGRQVGGVDFGKNALARVDVFNATSGNWMTATLSQARGLLPDPTPRRLLWKEGRGGVVLC